jgi:hypothetical protein
MRYVEHVAHKKEMRNAYKIMVGKLHMTKPLARHRNRWDVNIKIQLTPWSRVLLEKLTLTQLVMKFSIFYGPWRFISVYTWSHQTNPLHIHPPYFFKKNSNILTYLLTYLLHGAGYYLKSCCYSARQKISFLTEPEGSSPCSQKPATGPYPEPAESSLPHRSLSP